MGKTTGAAEKRRRRETAAWGAKGFIPISTLSDGEVVKRHDPATIFTPHRHTAECWIKLEGDAPTCAWCHATLDAHTAVKVSLNFGRTASVCRECANRVSA